MIGFIDATIHCTSQMLDKGSIHPGINAGNCIVAIHNQLGFFHAIYPFFRPTKADRSLSVLQEILSTSRSLFCLEGEIILRILVADIANNGTQELFVGRIAAIFHPFANEPAKNSAEVFMTRIAEE